MKNKLYSIGLFSLLSIVSLNTMASDGEINFTGSVTDTACTIDIGAGNKMTVALGDVAKTSFTGVGSTSSDTKFDITATACPSALAATVKFDGVAYAGDPNVLALDTPGTGTAATGIGVQIKDSTMTVVPLATSSSSYTLVATEPNILSFYASYIQKDATVVSGVGNATAQFTLNYN